MNDPNSENVLREDEEVATAVLSSFALDRKYWHMVREVAILAGVSQDDIRTFARSPLETPIAIRRAIAEGLGFTEAVDWYVEHDNQGMHALPLPDHVREQLGDPEAGDWYVSERWLAEASGRDVMWVNAACDCDAFQGAVSTDGGYAIPISGLAAYSDVSDHEYGFEEPIDVEGVVAAAIAARRKDRGRHLRVRSMRTRSPKRCPDMTQRWSRRQFINDGGNWSGVAMEACLTVSRELAGGVFDFVGIECIEGPGVSVLTYVDTARGSRGRDLRTWMTANAVEVLGTYEGQVGNHCVRSLVLSVQTNQHAAIRRALNRPG